MQAPLFRPRFIGIFFLVATAAGLINATILGPIFSADDLLASASSAVIEIQLATLLNTVMVIAIVAIAIGFFPVLAKTSPSMAMGFLVARVIEAAILAIAGAFWWVWFSDGPETAAFAHSVSVVLFGIGAQIVFGLMAVILNTSLFQTKTVLRLISVWCLIGGGLILAFGICTFLGADIVQLEPFFVAPIAPNELVLAILLIVKGF